MHESPLTLTKWAFAIDASPASVRLLVVCVIEGPALAEPPGVPQADWAFDFTALALDFLFFVGASCVAPVIFCARSRLRFAGLSGACGRISAAVDSFFTRAFFGFVPGPGRNRSPFWTVGASCSTLHGSAVVCLSTSSTSWAAAGRSAGTTVSATGATQCCRCQPFTITRSRYAQYFGVLVSTLSVSTYQKVRARRTIPFSFYTRKTYPYRSANPCAFPGR